MVHYADNSFVSDPGSPIHQLYTAQVSPNGEISLIQSGVENTDDYIQSFADSCDVEVIMRRVANGETELLKKRPGSYGDFTKLPKTYAEMLQLQIDSNRLFEALPLDVRNKFGNDANKFFASSGTKDWFEKIETVLPDEVKAAVFPVDPVPGPIEKEVKE